MMPRSARDGWLEELLDYLDERQDINNGGGANDYMRWHDALKLAIDALKTIHRLANEGLVTADEAIAQNAVMVEALRSAERLIENISEFGNVTDIEFVDEASSLIGSALALIGGDA